MLSAKPPGSSTKQTGKSLAAGDLLLTPEYQKRAQVAEKREEEARKKLEQADWRVRMPACCASQNSRYYTLQIAVMHTPNPEKTLV
jgi:hypothetical protein